MDFKFLIALQFWEQDLPQAQALCEFLAEIEPKKSTFADIILVRRFDSPSVADATVRNLMRKFHVWTYTSPKREVGWPNGCNGLWFATMEWAYSMMGAKKAPHYKAIFTCEADGGPIVGNWVERLSKEWDRVNNPEPVCIAGPLVTIPGEHINGNAMVSGDLENLRWITRELSGGLSGGWDWVLAPRFKQRGWANIPGIRSWYASQYFTQEQYAQMILDDLIWMHGDKSGCLRDWGRSPIIGVRAPEDLRRGYAETLVKAQNE